MTDRPDRGDSDPFGVSHFTSDLVREVVEERKQHSDYDNDKPMRHRDANMFEEQYFHPSSIPSVAPFANENNEPNQSDRRQEARNKLAKSREVAPHQKRRMKAPNENDESNQPDRRQEWRNKAAKARGAAPHQMKRTEAPSSNRSPPPSRAFTSRDYKDVLHEDVDRSHAANERVYTEPGELPLSFTNEPNPFAE